MKCMYFNYLENIYIHYIKIHIKYGIHCMYNVYLIYIENVYSVFKKNPIVRKCIFLCMHDIFISQDRTTYCYCGIILHHT